MRVWVGQHMVLYKSNAKLLHSLDGISLLHRSWVAKFHYHGSKEEQRHHGDHGDDRLISTNSHSHITGGNDVMGFSLL